jgi:hypothetical protein
MGAEDAHTEEWRDPSVAAWEEAAAASSSADGGAQGSHAQHAQPWTESLAPALVDAINSLDWAQVHRALIPNAWNRVRLGTFTETWAVFGVWPPSDTEHDEVTHGTRGTSKKRRVMLEAYGDGGLDRAMARLRPDDVQYIAMRVTNDAGEARFIAAAWLGPASDAFIREPEGGGGAAGHASTAEDGGAGGEDSSNLDAEMPEGMPADADPNARWRKEWAAVRHYLAGAHAYVAVDGREFVNGGAEGADTAVRMSSSSSFDFGAALRSDASENTAVRTTRATHYDYEAPGDAERNAAGEGVDALGAALATLAADERQGEKGEDEEDDDGNVEAALEARGEALSRLRIELAAAAASLMHTAWASDVARAVASHDTAREHTLRATEALEAEKSKALKERLAARARNRAAP